jgi:hypothetical protein
VPLNGTWKHLELDVAVGVNREHFRHFRLGVFATHRYMPARNSRALPQSFCFS